MMFKLFKGCVGAVHGHLLRSLKDWFRIVAIDHVHSTVTLANGWKHRVKDSRRYTLGATVPDCEKMIAAYERGEFVSVCSTVSMQFCKGCEGEFEKRFVTEARQSAASAVRGAFDSVGYRKEVV